MGYYEQTKTENRTAHMDVSVSAVLDGAYDPIPEETCNGARDVIMRYAPAEDRDSLLAMLGLID